MKADNFSFEDLNPSTIDKQLKQGVKTLTENMATIIVAVVIVMIFARVFFDVRIKDFFEMASYSDAVVIIIYSIVVQNTMAIKGNKNGKQDEEFIEARKEYKVIRDRIRDNGSPSIEEFCNYYVNNEYESARRGILSYTPLSYEIWQEHFEHLTPRKIKNLPKKYRVRIGERDAVFLITRKTKIRLAWLYKLKPVDITPEKLMIEFAYRMSRGGLPLTPEEELSRSDKILTVNTIILSSITGFIAFNLLTHFSWAALMSALTTLICVLYRGFASYYRHYVTFAERGPNYYAKQIEILVRYETWLKKEAG